MLFDLALRTISASEDEPANGGHVGEDTDAEHYNDGGLQLRADAKLIAEEHQQGCRQHVGQERR